MSSDIARTPWGALLERSRTDAAAPLVTYRDLTRGDRAELSAASLANAVAKTAGLLRDELDVVPGDRIGVLLPMHWQWAVWLGAASAVGAVIVPGSIESCTVAVVGAAGAEHALAHSAGEVVVVSLHPLGLPEGGVAPGALEHAVAARVHPDSFSPTVNVAPEAPLLVGDDGRLLTAVDVAAHARRIRDERGAPPGGRLLLRDDRDSPALALPLALGGSVVLLRHATADTQIDQVAREERVDA